MLDTIIRLLTQTREDCRYAILDALCDGPSWASEIVQRVNQEGSVVLGPWNVYTLLRDLEAEGLIESWDGERLLERGGRPRRYYRLVDDGCE